MSAKLTLNKESKEFNRRHLKDATRYFICFWILIHINLVYLLLISFLSIDHFGYCNGKFSSILTFNLFVLRHIKSTTICVDFVVNYFTVSNNFLIDSLGFSGHIII